MKYIHTLVIISLSVLFNSCYEESRLLVNSSFEAKILEDKYTAPVKIQLANNCTGADFYQWTFEGGSPASSTQKVPENVTYEKAGTYTIRLEAWNDHEKDSKEFTFTVDSAVTVDFDLAVIVNPFAPAQVKITNKTQGASEYQWTFEGGQPTSSTDQHPANVFFETPGEHNIHLVVKNGRESFTLSKKIVLEAPLSVAFEIEPSFDDFDYEAPFTAKLLNKTISGLTYEWTCSGNGSFTNKTAKDTELTIQNAGTYTITLKADNGNQTKTISKQIVIKANSNLYTIKDVKFGVKSAVSTLGSFYSLKQRKVIPQNEVSILNGKDINLVFFGLNENFSKCYFISPQLVSGAGFYPIPDARQTYFVNVLEATGLRFSSTDFEAMLTDLPLRSLDIKSASSVDTWFIANPVPRIILFETADGRKGALKIKAFVSELGQSYILTDIKYQKEKVY